MKSRLLGLLLIAVVVTLTSGRGLQADSTEIWNTGNITTISHNSFPQIKGNCLVWQGRGGLGGATSGSGDWEIFLYDIHNQVGIQVTDDDYDDISPQTDGDYVVWQKHDTTRSNQIFLYKIHGENLAGGSMISNDDNKDNYSPRIAAGRAVWTSQRVAHSFEPGEILLYDARSLSGPASISDNTCNCSFPRINSDTIVWVQSDGNGTASLFVYDLTSENSEPAPDGFVWTGSPQTDGDLTVSTRYDGSDREIFLYNTATQELYQITDNDLEDRDPRISGKNIAWVGGEGQASEIFVNADVEPIEPAQPGSNESDDDDGRCFIATAAFGSYVDPHVQVLRDFRDEFLLTNMPGRWLVNIYYTYGPFWADLLNAYPGCKPFVRLTLMPVVGISYFVLNTSLAIKLLTGFLLVGFIVICLKNDSIVKSLLSKVIGSRFRVQRL